jgi:hypothetical protein
MWKLWQNKSPGSPITDERIWRDDEETLRRTTILEWYQEDSSKSEDWKVCRNSPQSLTRNEWGWRDDGETSRRPTTFEINQEDSSKSENWNFCINPRSTFLVERGAIGNTRWWSRKGPDESGSSQKWKADTRLGGGYHGSTSRRVFCTNFSHFPSYVPKQK